MENQVSFYFMLQKFLKLSLILSVTAILVGGCSLPSSKKAVAPAETAPIVETAPTTEAPSTNRLKKFNDYDELAQFLIDNINPETVSISNTRESAASAGAIKSLALTAAPPAVPGSTAADMPTTDSSVPNNSLDYSATNVQVAGVDEADIIKTDGVYIYALVKNELSIIKATPANEAQVVSKITFQSRPQDILINDNFLAVFGSNDQIRREPFYRDFRRQNSYTFFKVFDISNPVSPRAVRDLNFEGSYYDARLIGDYVYFLTNTPGNYIADEPLLPRVLENGQVLATKCDATLKCFAPDVYYFDIPYDSQSFLNITAINIVNNAEAIGGQAYLISHSQNLYVSQNNIYITYTQYLSEYELEQEVKQELIFSELSDSDQNKITAIQAAPGFVLNKNEKKYKVAQIIDRYWNSLDAAARAVLDKQIDAGLEKKLTEKAKDMEKTIIHKIAVSGRKIEYRAMGEVPGQLLNQFSMDENGAYFRVATTRNPQNSRLSTATADSYNNIYVLDANLKIVGSLSNLATAEKIYAVRFIGNRAYLVTFKQIDPLFVIDLTDPKKPAVLGAVKVPGFSNYLHPVDKDGNQLIGLGREAEETDSGGVKIKGLKLSLFDFTDLKNPKELDSYLIGDASSDSIALYDHKAFLYAPEKKILSLPATLYENGRLSFSGALVFTLENNQLALQGRIDHSVGGYFSQNDYWSGFSYRDNTVKRSLYIGNQLYTLSNKFLKINDLTALTETKSLELTVGGDDYIITSPAAVEPIAEMPVEAEGTEVPEDLVAPEEAAEIPAETPEAPEETAAPI
ncbi:TPA: hypothetical protein DCZ15_03725 [Candidatus Falkowbacteria bacterium]|nr:hypothetical protein [Candidatus Falkowbacteria bacterium]